MEVTMMLYVHRNVLLNVRSDHFYDITLSNDKMAMAIVSARRRFGNTIF